MPIKTPNTVETPTNAEPEPDGGCAFVLEEDTRAIPGRTYCGVTRRAGSAYCDRHHELCHLPSESLAERRKLDEIEALAEAVGGKRGRPARRPPPRFLVRMDQISRAALRPDRSRNVLYGQKRRGADIGADQ